MRIYSCQIQQRAIRLLRVRKEQNKCNYQEEADFIFQSTCIVWAMLPKTAYVKHLEINL